MFISEELARYAADKFLDIYKAYYTQQQSSSTAQSQSSISVEDIKSFEDACKVKGYDPEKVLPNESMYPVRHRKALIATEKLFIVNEVLNYIDNGNKDWVPDWDDDDEEKYYPWFDLEKDNGNPSGFRLDGVFCAYTASGVGSRLVYRTRKLAEYAGTQFEALYRDLMVLE